MFLHCGCGHITLKWGVVRANDHRLLFGDAPQCYTTEEERERAMVRGKYLYYLVEDVSSGGEREGREEEGRMMDHWGGTMGGERERERERERMS